MCAHVQQSTQHTPREFTSNIPSNHHTNHKILQPKPRRKSAPDRAQCVGDSGDRQQSVFSPIAKDVFLRSMVSHSFTVNNENAMLRQYVERYQLDIVDAQISAAKWKQRYRALQIRVAELQTEIQELERDYIGNTLQEEFPICDIENINDKKSRICCIIL